MISEEETFSPLERTKYITQALIICIKWDYLNYFTFSPRFDCFVSFGVSAGQCRIWKIPRSRHVTRETSTTVAPPVTSRPPAIQDPVAAAPGPSSPDMMGTGPQYSIQVFHDINAASVKIAAIFPRWNEQIISAFALLASHQIIFGRKQSKKTTNYPCLHLIAVNSSKAVDLYRGRRCQRMSLNMHDYILKYYTFLSVILKLWWLPCF